MLKMMIEMGRIALKRMDGYSLLAHEEYGPEFKGVYQRCRKYTMTSVERMAALYEAVKYVVAHDVPGDLVECGVYQGGSAMVMALALQEMEATDRKLYLYDTYAGMSEPTEKDVDFDNHSARQKWEGLRGDRFNSWCYSSLEEVRGNLRSTGYPKEHLVFIEGKVEDTIPGVISDRVALLRLDTDWYESTYHELTHLFPRVSPGGVMIIDDYGHWKGARQATDQYFAEQGVKMLLNRIDYTGRIGVKR